ncbi:hypothetical protein [Agromyces sp. Root81]|uniref:hypothetical protein n=1 Tax=Agromyces sp. Root81 TaxID=1736601 RepID=UPI0012FBB526|nr:hypothetical protein [Agromyces sp. Root81]
MNDIGQFLMLVLRGLLLWAVIPLAALSWIVLGPLTAASLGACVGWFDLNLIVLLQRFVLRPFVRDLELSWVPLSKMKTTEHRVTLLGLA